jgi:TIR domain-containing protein
MKLFISWSGQISKGIAGEFREWLPLINQTIVPYMSSEDIEKGTHWSSSIRRELETSSFGILILTPENTHSTWLHFEAGAIAKSVAEGRVAPILFGLKQSDIEQPLSLFQATLFEKDEIHRLMKTINSAAGAEAREERQLETVFNSFWPKLEASIKPKLEKLRNRPPKKDEGKLESERILQELLILARQQIRILASPDELFGKETLGLLLRIIHEPDGAAMRLAGKERDLVLALCARWGQLERSLRTNLQGLEGQAKTRSMGVIDRFSGYVTELQSILSGTATPESIIKAFGQKSL